MQLWPHHKASFLILTSRKNARFFNNKTRNRLIKETWRIRIKNFFFSLVASKYKTLISTLFEWFQTLQNAFDFIKISICRILMSWIFSSSNEFHDLIKLDGIFLWLINFNVLIYFTPHYHWDTPRLRQLNSVLSHDSHCHGVKIFFVLFRLSTIKTPRIMSE